MSGAVGPDGRVVEPRGDENEQGDEVEPGDSSDGEEGARGTG
jgi:hypothetical protein